jgi:hypothetical protein
MLQVSTRHGHPLHPRDKEEKHSTPFPWKKLAYLRWVLLRDPEQVTRAS